MDSYVFVYGTLMKNQRNHYLLKDCEFIAKGYIENYFMFNISTYPGIQKSKYQSRVYGEVYLINDEVEKQLDILEEVNVLYSKEEVQVYLKDKIIKANAYIYILKQYEEEKEKKEYCY